MDIQKSCIVSSRAGRDKGRLFVVMESEPDFVYLVDGKLRKVELPKKKRVKHVALKGRSSEQLAEKILSGDKVLNSEIRRALAEFSKENSGDDAQQA